VKKRAQLYVIAAAPDNVIPISSAYAPRERSWRDIVRRLEKNPVSSTPAPHPHVNAISKEKP